MWLKSVLESLWVCLQFQEWYGFGISSETDMGSESDPGKIELWDSSTTVMDQFLHRYGIKVPGMLCIFNQFQDLYKFDVSFRICFLSQSVPEQILVHVQLKDCYKVHFCWRNDMGSESVLGPLWVWNQYLLRYDFEVNFRTDLDSDSVPGRIQTRHDFQGRFRIEIYARTDMDFDMQRGKERAIV